MSALNELGIQCERRGWRLAIDGHYPNGRLGDGLELKWLEVRARTDLDGTYVLHASVDFDPANPDAAAIEAARALEAKGLIA